MSTEPLGPQYHRDPFLVFDRLREDAPVCWSPRLRRFVLTRHAEVEAVLRDPATFSSAVVPQVPAADRDLLAGFAEWSARWLFFLDPPEHTVRRAPLARSLSARAVAPRAEPIAALARDLVAALPGPRFDALADFAHPLAARVIAGLLCPPGEPTEAFLARARALERAGADARDPDARRAGLAAIAASVAAIRSTMDPAADDEWVGAHRLMLIFAGVETTQNLIANTVHALLRHPRAWSALARQPALIPGAVEEGARYAPPVLGVVRRTTRAVELAGRPIPAGAELVAMTAAANRDPARFPDPARFDPARRPNPHLSFGLGRHYCPGAELTRLTARAALTALLDAFPALALTGPRPRPRDHDPIIHAPVNLLVHAG